jgi:hypothetical protein
VTYVGWSGTVETFDIASEKYALGFMLSNRSKLINGSPETWSKLGAIEMLGVSPSQTAGPSQASTPPQRGDDVLLRWIRGVESAKGPAARRATMELALKDAGLNDRREEFIRTAAQVEVRATLDKVDTLKTGSAKRRYIMDALSALRGDSAPDDLQEAEIRCLEEALRELDTNGR